MAVIADVLGEARARFTAWAREYVYIPPQLTVRGAVRGDVVDDVVRLLVDGKVFKKAEIEMIAKRRGFSGIIVFDKIKE